MNLEKKPYICSRTSTILAEEKKVNRLNINVI